MLRFKSLGSGSSGNATLVEAQSGVHTTRLLIDCGIRLRDLETRLIEAGTCAEDLDAIFITHPTSMAITLVVHAALLNVTQHRCG